MLVDHENVALTRAEFGARDDEQFLIRSSFEVGIADIRAPELEGVEFRQKDGEAKAAERYDTRVNALEWNCGQVPVSDESSLAFQIVLHSVGHVNTKFLVAGREGCAKTKIRKGVVIVDLLKFQKLGIAPQRVAIGFV